MDRTDSPKLILAVVCCFATGASAEQPRRLDEVLAPVVVGTPPANAFNGLFRCSDGEIRHYGADGFLYSRDHGLVGVPRVWRT
jgi:hypothetical protein